MDSYSVIWKKNNSKVKEIVFFPSCVSNKWNACWKAKQATKMKNKKKASTWIYTKNTIMSCLQTDNRIIHDSFSPPFSLSLALRSLFVPYIAFNELFHALHASKCERVKHCVHSEWEKKRKRIFKLQNCLFTLQSKYEFSRLTAL